MPTAQETFWSGDFGNQYIERNRFDYTSRIPYWRDMLALMDPLEYVCEVGCNIGSNLKALRDVAPETTMIRGIDVNQAAIDEVQMQGFMARVLPAVEVGNSYPESFDLIFTAGVLIHIPEDQIGAVMDQIIRASRRYVLAIEYAAPESEEIPYRGHTERLWRRPFGQMYADKGLTLLDVRDADTGFDACVSWLLEKSA